MFKCVLHIDAKINCITHQLLRNRNKFAGVEKEGIWFACVLHIGAKMYCNTHQLLRNRNNLSNAFTPLYILVLYILVLLLLLFLI